MNGDLLFLLAVSMSVGIFLLWAKFIYEPRQRVRDQRMARLWECAMAKILLKGETTESQKVLLNEIKARRPSIQSWPEWQEVWEGNPPVH